MAGQDECSRCHAPVKRVITLGAQVRDLEPTPHAEGNNVLVTRDDGSIRAHVLTGPEMPAQGEAYVIHRCPPKPRPGPSCAGCGLPMDRELAELERWIWHPCCDPSYLRELAEVRVKEGW